MAGICFGLVVGQSFDFKGGRFGCFDDGPSPDTTYLGRIFDHVVDITILVDTMAQLGGHFHVPHGLSNALVLPHVLEFNMPAAQPLYAEIAPIVFPELSGKAEAARAEGLVEGFRTLGPELGMQSKLSDVGVNHNHLPMLAEDAMKQERLLINNPREMTYEAALDIYARAL